MLALTLAQAKPLAGAQGEEASIEPAVALRPPGWLQASNHDP
jgi:hypothetical protein